MKLLSYNIFGLKDTEKGVPDWNIRQENVSRMLNIILKDSEIKVACFQEVNLNNMDNLSNILIDNNFVMLDKFPMKTESYNQYNIIAVRKELINNIENVICIPHGKDDTYVNVEKQEIDYQMSDYRTTIFVQITIDGSKYLIGNTHTDYISTEGKIKGVIKSLNYMDTIESDYKVLIGDMNMVTHMSEAYNILKSNNNYITLSRSKNFDILDNSWHGYGLKEQVNVDFAFVEKSKYEKYEYKIIKQENMYDEGSDHRPVIITVL